MTDSDNDDVLSVSNLSLVDSIGSIVDNGNGSWTFTPNTGFYGNVEISYIVEDGNSGELTRTATFYYIKNFTNSVEYNSLNFSLALIKNTIDAGSN